MAPRHDIYAFIHKGLRAFMSHALVHAGRLDAHDPVEVAEARAEIGALLDICEHHLHNESSVVHAALEQRAPGVTCAIDADHAEHTSAIARLRLLLAGLDGDAATASALYRALAAFVAHNLEHMAVEESDMNIALWATHSDDEIRALEQRIVSGHTPEQMQLAMRWMLPHMNPAERAEMLGGMRHAAPAPVFDGLLGSVRPLLGGRDWRKLSAALGL